MNALPQPTHFDNKRMLWLEVTNFCNLACAHCYNSSGSHESLTPSVTPERYEQILDEASQLGFRGVQFIGGEPLFYPHLQRLVDRAIDLGFGYVEIYSNLTVLPPWLLEPRYKAVSLATSFYSDDPKIHDAICGAERSFERTVQSIRRVIDAGYRLRVGFIDMERNKGGFERTRAFLEGLGVADVGRDSVRRFGRAGSGAAPSLSQLCGRCGNGNLSIAVDGNVSACIMSKPWAFGNIREGSLAAIFESSERRRFVDDLHSLRRRIEPSSCDPDCRPVTECNPNCAPSTDCHPNGSGIEREERELEREIEEEACGPDCRPVTECNPNCQPSVDCVPTRRVIEREVEEIEKEVRREVRELEKK